MKYALLIIILFVQAYSLRADEDFYSTNISQEIFERMKDKSYKSDCTVDTATLRYLHVLHYDLEGNVHEGEMVCNVSICNDLLDIFQKLYEAHYPIEKMELVDNYDADDEKSMSANNTSCFNFRRQPGSRYLSKHSRGLAVDINPLYNPYVRHSRGKLHIEPTKGKNYADRKKQFPYKIDRNDLCYKLFIEHGFSWGGAWKSVKDYQHFEK